MNPRPGGPTAGDDGTWRLRQQSAQLSRLFLDAGLSGRDTLETVERLGQRLAARVELTSEAVAISADIATRSSRGFDELTTLQEQTDATERMARSIYDDLRRAAVVDNDAAAGVTDLLDALQELRAVDLD